MKFELARGRNFFHTIWTPYDLLLAFKEDISDGIQFFFTKEEEKSILSICEEQISKRKLEGMSDDQYDKELILVSLKWSSFRVVRNQAVFSTQGTIVQQTPCHREAYDLS